jgi:hypothetical protein
MSAPLQDRMPLRHVADTIGREHYYLAAQLRELMATFNTPGSCIVVHCDGVEPCVRVSLPCPCGPHLAHWMQRTVSVYKFRSITFSAQSGRQVFHLMADSILDQHPGIIYQPDGQCPHGQPLCLECPNCNDCLPF